MVRGVLMPEQFRLTIESAPGWSAPAIVRVRRPLKVLLRAFGLKCVDLTEMPPANDDRTNSSEGSARK